MVKDDPELNGALGQTDMDGSEVMNRPIGKVTPWTTNLTA